MGSSLLLLLLGLVTRRLLVYNFGTQISTASQVVTQLFNFFSIAEFGVGSVISYRLYEQIAAKNADKISKYMSMYKWAYRAVGLAIALLALLGAAALPWIMPDVPLVTGYTVYGLNVVSTLCSYFLVTRRLMYTCTQQGYLCTRIDFCFNVLTSLAKIAVSLWFPNYVLYFSVAIVCNVCANLVIARRFRKDFPYVRDVKVSLQDFKDLGIFHDLRYYLVHGCPTRSTARRTPSSPPAWAAPPRPPCWATTTNISTSATDLGNKIMDSFAAAIGNIVYDKSAAANDHDKQVFWGMDLFSYPLCQLCGHAYFCLFQPFMAAWMGADWLLPLGFVLVFCLNEYVGWNHRMLGSYRAVLGHFEQDQCSWWLPPPSTCCSASPSSRCLISPAPHCHRGGPLHHVGGAHRGGLPPVYAGQPRHYLRAQALHLVTLAVCMGGTWTLCEAVPIGGWAGPGCPGRSSSCVVPNLFNLIVYGWGRDAVYLRQYGAALLQKLRHKRSA